MLIKAEPSILRPNQGAWDAFMRLRYAELADIAHQLAIGAITPDEWADRFHAILLEGHANANMMGRNLAGDMMGRTGLDDLVGRGRADLESTWMQPFIEDIVSGRYDDEDGVMSEDAVRNRSQMYAGKMRATTSKAWVDTGPPDILYQWVLVAENHCDDCPRIAAISPFTVDTLFTHPGDGDTQCLTNCQCYLRRDDGVEMFRPYPRAA